MKKLPQDFQLKRYGVDVRLVEEKDAEFILSLRTDEKLARFLHKTDNDINKQIEWIKAYKEREKQGIDYYFIYFYQDIPYALNRIYDITEQQCTGGSWISKPGTNVEQTMATMLIARDIMFEELEIKQDMFDVRKGNKQVQKIHKMMGAKQVGETELDYLYSMNEEDYYKGKENIIRLLNLKY